jgi:hypothetical protein
MNILFRQPARTARNKSTSELEWLGGEALVAPLPIFRESLSVVREVACDKRHEDVVVDWIAL